MLSAIDETDCNKLSNELLSSHRQNADSEGGSSDQDNASKNSPNLHCRAGSPANDERLRGGVDAFNNYGGDHGSQTTRV